MNLTNPDELKNYLRAHGFKPKDYLGQNFLVDDGVLNEILAVAQLKKTDTVLEVGPGLGVLTQELINRAGKVIAVEKDEKLFNILKKNVAEDFSPPNDGSLKISATQLEIINQDILRFHLDKYIEGPYKVVANIPYYLTSKLFQYFLEQKNKPQLMVLMVQKEVGERVVAKPGELSILGISVQIYSNPSIEAFVSKTSFWPIPEVDSVILKIIPRDKYPEIEDKKKFFRILKIAFAGKRKQLKNTLKDIDWQKVDIDPTLRPQDLSIENWDRLYQVIDKSLVRD